MMAATSLPYRAGPRNGAIRSAARVGLLAWGVLILLAASPAAGLLDHGSWTDPGVTRLLCLGEDGTLSLGVALASLGAWLAMVLAMMWVPAVLEAPEHRPSGAEFAGFLAVWTGYGIAAHLLGAALGAYMLRSDAFALSAWPIGAALFAVAGAMELRGCAAQQMDRTCWWHMGWQSLRSCWALMGLMFAYFSDSLLWMMALSALMFVNCTGAHRGVLKRALGLALLATSGLIAAFNLA